jgi:cell division protease FtsH
MNGSPDLKKKTSFSILYIVLAFLILTILQSWLSPRVENVSYSEFKRYVEEGKITSVVVST